MDSASRAVVPSALRRGIGGASWYDIVGRTDQNRVDVLIVTGVGFG